MLVTLSKVFAPRALSSSQRRFAISEGGRYGRVSEQTFYEMPEPEQKVKKGVGRSRAFQLGVARRALINRNRQRIGLPPVLNWNKFTREAVRVRDELVGLDDPRAQQQIERERSSKLGSTRHLQDINHSKSRPMAKYSQTSSMYRASGARSPMDAINSWSQYKDCVNVARVVNESNRDSVAESLKGSGRPIPASKIKYVTRPPVVAVMGHVDHGKTTLLDTLRKSNVAAGEAGGITQAIGAFQVPVAGFSQNITFIDTPGHEAFESMRTAGIVATDVVVLVVSVTGGVQKQTLEVIESIKRHKVPVVVALNKIDRSSDLETDVNRIQNSLEAAGLSVFSGDVQTVRISAKKGTGIDDLLEAISLEAEDLELRSAQPCRAEAYVLESNSTTSVEARSNKLVNVIVKRGVLKPGMNIVTGGIFTTIKKLLSPSGEVLTEATPSQPCSIDGFNSCTPSPNSIIVDAGRRIDKNEWAKFWSAFIHAKAVQGEWKDETDKSTRMLFWNERPDAADEALPAAQRRSNVPHLRIILKASTQGMVDAMEQAVANIPELKEVSCRVISKGVGDVNTDDGALYLARPDDSLILGCGVKDNSLEVFEHISLVDIIYDITEAVHQRMLSYYPPIKKETTTGTASVKNVFTFSGEKVGNVAGMTVNTGTLHVKNPVKVIRNGEEVFRNEKGRCIKSLRHVKEERDEIERGMDCGLILDDGFTFQVGDQVSQFQIETVPPTLFSVFGEEHPEYAKSMGWSEQ
eukprot:TRINITY_DN21415_c0_g1_i1.p1 TRINITY_DN21415_c0_g1~~TRINITY_DN21415_c0_g1_i1.p1  ORF type:complete len:748 (+),score=108.42 TRINITY_DN21415_c0_g1_i1:46-2289(+)